MLKITQTNVTIMVKDMERSIRFYESIGFTTLQRWENHYCMMTTTGLTIGLHPSEEEVIPNSQISIGMMIENANDAKAFLEKLNIKYTFHDESAEGIYLHFNDPDGTFLYFTQPLWK